MLVTFRFKNFGPFKEEAVLDMRAVKEYEEHPDNVITIYESTPILKVASIYGANASGKTHVAEAYEAFLRIIRDSFHPKDKKDLDSVLETYYEPYLFDEESSSACTEFEAVYLDGRYELKYGFSYDDVEIEYEWLYQTDLATDETNVILERDGKQIVLGDSVKDSCDKYLNDIDSDVLALSFMSSLKLETDVFATTLSEVSSFLPVFLSDNDWADVILHRYWQKDFDENERPRLLKFLKGIDVGICDVKVEKNGKRVNVYTYHKDSDGELIPVPLSIESDGTRRAIALYSLMGYAAKVGSGLIIDEFHSQLHPLLQKYLLDLFYEESITGQVIYTTHDTSLLDKKYVRRDQVWFVEKDDQGEASLYSLDDFLIRNDDSFSEDYLGGVYGAIPRLKDFSFGEVT